MAGVSHALELAGETSEDVAARPRARDAGEPAVEWRGQLRAGHHARGAGHRPTRPQPPALTLSGRDHGLTLVTLDR